MLLGTWSDHSMWQKIGKDGETSTAANATTTTTEFGLPVVVDHHFLPLLQSCQFTKDGKTTKQLDDQCFTTIGPQSFLWWSAKIIKLMTFQSNIEFS